MHILRSPPEETERMGWPFIERESILHELGIQIYYYFCPLHEITNEFIRKMLTSSSWKETAQNEFHDFVGVILGRLHFRGDMTQILRYWWDQHSKTSVKRLILFCFFFFIAFLLKRNLTFVKIIAWIHKIANWFGFNWTKLKQWRPLLLLPFWSIWSFHPRELVCYCFYLVEQAYSLIYMCFASLIVKLLLNRKRMMGFSLLRS